MAHILQTLLSGHPLLSGHLGRSRRCPLNRGFTVLECGRPICLSTTSMIRERIQRHEVPLPNLYYFKLLKIHSRAREIAHTTSKACEYCLQWKKRKRFHFVLSSIMHRKVMHVIFFGLLSLFYYYHFFRRTTVC